jgi:hypothetical protein
MARAVPTATGRDSWRGKSKSRGIANEGCATHEGSPTSQCQSRRQRGAVSGHHPPHFSHPSWLTPALFHALLTTLPSIPSLAVIRLPNPSAFLQACPLPACSASLPRQATRPKAPTTSPEATLPDALPPHARQYRPNLPGTCSSRPYHTVDRKPSSIRTASPCPGQPFSHPPWAPSHAPSTPILAPASACRPEDWWWFHRCSSGSRASIPNPCGLPPRPLPIQPPPWSRSANRDRCALPA